MKILLTILAVLITLVSVNYLLQILIAFGFAGKVWGEAIFYLFGFLLSGILGLMGVIGIHKGKIKLYSIIGIILPLIILFSLFFYQKSTEVKKAIDAEKGKILATLINSFKNSLSPQFQEKIEENLGEIFK